MVAAMKTETDHLGVVCALNVDSLNMFVTGFIAGAEHINPDIAVDVKYVGSFSIRPPPKKWPSLCLRAAPTSSPLLQAAPAWACLRRRPRRASLPSAAIPTSASLIERHHALRYPQD